MLDKIKRISTPTGVLVCMLSALVVFNIIFSVRTVGPPANDSPSSADVYASGSDVSGGDAVEEEPHKIESLSSELRSELGQIFYLNGTANASVAVIVDGQVCYHHEYGFADVLSRRAMNPTTKMRVASLTKVVGAMMTLSLCEDRKLTLDDDVSKILGYRISQNADEEHIVTVRDLLLHISSLDDSDNLKFNRTPWASLKDQIKGCQTRSKPGEKYNYANINYMINGAIIEKISGQYLQEFAYKRFFGPMGLDCGYDAATMKDTSDFAILYDDKGGLRLDVERQSTPKDRRDLGENYALGAGGLMTNAADLAALVTVLINDGEYFGERYLSEKSVALMETPAFDCEGYQQCIGLRTRSDFLGDRTIYYHNGFAYGVCSLLLYDKEARSGVVIITSGASFNMTDGMYEVCRAAAEALYAGIEGM